MLAAIRTRPRSPTAAAMASSPRPIHELPQTIEVANSQAQREVPNERA